MKHVTLLSDALALLHQIEKENYLGYDPYDFYLSPIAKFLPKSIWFLHLQKFSPINFRPIIGIKKGMVTKVYALMIDSYLNLYEYTSEKVYLEKAESLFHKMLKAAVVSTSEEVGWGRNYPFKTGGEIHDDKKPLVYLDSRIGLAIVHLYDVTKEKSLIPLLHKIITNILRTGRVLKKEGYSFIGYSPDKNTRLTFNASMVAAELFFKYLDRSKQSTCYIDGLDLRKVAEDIVRTMIHYQEEDGSWAYGFSAKGNLFAQRDFHQGFVIDSLYLSLPYIHDVSLKKQAMEAYNKGYAFLKTIQIDKDGAFYWRYPKKYPIDIHNQAQGILSLSINKSDDDDMILNRIVEYTMENFWNRQRGNFYYQLWPLFRNKISYSRWCNAWMLFSMTTLLNYRKTNN